MIKIEYDDKDEINHLFLGILPKDCPILVIRKKCITYHSIDFLSLEGYF